MNTKIAFVRKVGYGWSFRGFGGSRRFSGKWSISGVMIESQVLCSSFRIDCMIVQVTLQYVGWEKIQWVATCWALFVAKALVMVEVYWDLLRYLEDLKDLKKGKIFSVWWLNRRLCHGTDCAKENWMCYAMPGFVFQDKLVLQRLLWKIWQIRRQTGYMGVE